MTIEDSLENELNENAKLLLGGDIEIDYVYIMLHIPHLTIFLISHFFL